MPGMPNMPHTEVTANAAQKKKKGSSVVSVGEIPA
jgi:hypothetical protein